VGEQIADATKRGIQREKYESQPATGPVEECAFGLKDSEVLIKLTWEEDAISEAPGNCRSSI
jgi:hypothetical protein